MRVRMYFKISKFPLYQRLATLSIIKDMIRSGSESYYQKIFEHSRYQIKPYAYSIFFRNFQVQNDVILADELHLTVSSPHIEFIMHLINGSQKKKTYQYKDYTILFQRLELLKTIDITDSVVTFSTLSPILIEDRNKTPLEPSSPYYEQELQYTAQLIVQAIQQRPLHSQIRIIDSNLQKQVIKENFHQSLNHELYFTAFKGNITLEGHPEDLQCLYDSGIGKRTNIAFGLLGMNETK